MEKERKNKKSGEDAPHTPLTSIKIFYRDLQKIKKKKDKKNRKMLCKNWIGEKPLMKIFMF